MTLQPTIDIPDLTPPVRPGRPAPDLDVPLAGAGSWSLRDSRPPTMTMIIFYRGHFCSVCQPYLRGLNRILPRFEDKGVEVIAVSADSAERAAAAVDEWKLDRLRIGYGLTSAQMRPWGLFLSRGGGERADVYSEPGLFMVRPDGTLFWQAIQSLPWGRPRFDELLPGLDYMAGHDWAVRGDL